MTLPSQCRVMSYSLLTDRPPLRLQTDPTSRQLQSWSIMQSTCTGYKQRSRTWLSRSLGAPLLMNCTMALSADIVNKDACPAHTRTSSSRPSISITLHRHYLLYSRSLHAFYN